MALTNCTESNKVISDKAELCPGCGCPIDIINAQPLHVNTDRATINNKTSVSRDNYSSKPIKHSLHTNNGDIKSASFTLLAVNAVVTISYLSLLWYMMQPTLNRRILYDYTNGNHGYFMLVPLILAFISLFGITKCTRTSKIMSALYYISASIVYISLNLILSKYYYLHNL